MTATPAPAARQVTRPPRSLRVSAVSTAVVFAGLLSFALERGQDGNFDQANYHYVYARMFLDGTLDRAGLSLMLQSYFNPIVNVPWTLLVDHLTPRLATAVIVCVQACNFLLARSLARLLLRDADVAPLRAFGWTVGGRDFCANVAGLVGVTGATFLSEVGTSFSDSWTSLLLLGAVRSVLSFDSPPVRRSLLAGVLMGVAAGLKNTNAVFLVPVALGAVWPGGGVRRALPRLSALGLGVVAGLLAAGGWWALHLQRTRDSPVFPLYNSIFRSPSVPAIDFHDDQYRAGTALEILTLPFRMATGHARVAELGIRDGRWLLVVVLGGVAAIVAVVRRQQLLQLRSARAAFLSMVLVAFLVWATTFGYARYLVFLEVVTGVVMAVLITSLMPGSRRAPWLVAGLALVALASGTTPDWQHGRFGSTWFDVDQKVLDALPNDAVVLTDGDSGPLSYAAATLPPSVTFVAVSRTIGLVIDASARPSDPYKEGVGLARELNTALERWGNAQRPLYVLVGTARPRTQANLGAFDVKISQRCQRLTRPSDPFALLLCEAEHLPAGQRSAPLT